MRELHSLVQPKPTSSDADDGNCDARSVTDAERRMGKMLVNMMGIEETVEVTNINSRRTDSAADPKDRVTLTTIVGALLTSFTTTDSPEPTAPSDAQVTAIAHGAVVSRTRVDPELHEDVA
jgi:hypothetical protein